MGKSKTVSIKDTIVGNLIHGKNDVTCGGLLNEPLHKLSEKANKEYVEIKLDELKAIDDVGGDIKYEEPLYYPSVLQKDKKIKYGDKCYQVQQDSNLFIDYSKLNVGEVSYNDLLGLFNETGCYVPDSIVDFFSGTMYSDGFNIILPKSKTESEQNLYKLFDFETFIDDKTMIETVVGSHFKNDIVNDSYVVASINSAIINSKNKKERGIKPKHLLLNLLSMAFCDGISEKEAKAIRYFASELNIDDCIDEFSQSILALSEIENQQKFMTDSNRQYYLIKENLEQLQLRRDVISTNLQSLIDD